MKKTALSLWESVMRTDRDAAQARVAALRARYPESSREQLQQILVRSKCLQAGAIGALTALSSAIPGLSRVTSFAFGPLLDSALVSSLQAELVIETLALYEVKIPQHGEKVAVLAIAATNLGADELARQASQWLTDKAARWVGGRWLRRAWPIANIGTAAASHIILTYSIGKRTQTLCQLRDARVSDWPSLFKRVVSIDPMQLTDWASQAARLALEQAAESAKSFSQRIGKLLPEVDFLDLAASPPDHRKLAAPSQSADRVVRGAGRRGAPETGITKTAVRASTPNQSPRPSAKTRATKTRARTPRSKK